VWDAFARCVLHAGPVGSAAKLKLATNLVLGLNRAALAEGLAFAQALGLDAAVTLQALRDGLAYSRIMDSKGPKLLAGDFTPQAKLSQHLKDVRLMLSAAESAALPLPLSETHRRLLEAAVTAGWGELDNSAIYRLYGTEHLLRES
jgi:3-hydroxyisobutyrate dehydrogenase-like beta-hydroxyacid dehydrogenase